MPTKDVVSVDGKTSKGSKDKSNNVIDFAAAARHHWGVESMHWSLDVTFGDDRNQTREGVAAQNLAIVKRLVFNTRIRRGRSVLTH